MQRWRAVAESDRRIIVSNDYLTSIGTRRHNNDDRRTPGWTAGRCRSEHPRGGTLVSVNVGMPRDVEWR